MLTTTLIALVFITFLGGEETGAEEYVQVPRALFGSDFRAISVSGELPRREESSKAPTGSDVRAVLDGKYALTAEQYAEYQACIGKVGLGAGISEYRAEVAKCKMAAQQEGYRLSPDQKEHDDSTSKDPRVERDRAWQERQLTK